MSLRFLARLTSSHGLVNSFNCDNNVIQGLIPSGLLQDGRHFLASKCEEIIRGIQETTSQAADMSLNVELFLTTFFQIWPPNWPVFHRPTFNSTLKPPTLIAALSLIGAILSPERKQLENWIFQGPDFNEDIVPQTDDDNQAYHVLQRLDIAQAAYAIVMLMNWEGNTKTRLRARRTRFPDIVYVARSLYAFAMPGTKFALREELIRTLLYTFLLDSAFVMFYNMSPRMVINELEFGLASTDEHFGASDAEAWFMSTQAAENRAVACSQVTLSQSLSMIMTEDCGATQWGIFEQMTFHNLIYRHQNGPDQGSRSLSITRGLRNWFRIWFRIWSNCNFFSTAENYLSFVGNKIGFFLHADEYWCLANLFCRQLETGINPPPSIW
ncbi:hypothetical protein IWW34DRAFT_801455 [Fusarium oxysporum f. sp. albedinis]|nr:hypothetical protein IWW34DRAFT_801455 [Fusarium oxysporum f. sp. albedinis]